MLVSETRSLIRLGTASTSTICIGKMHSAGEMIRAIGELVRDGLISRRDFNHEPAAGRDHHLRPASPGQSPALLQYRQRVPKSKHLPACAIAHRGALARWPWRADRQYGRPLRRATAAPRNDAQMMQTEYGGASHWCRAYPRGPRRSASAPASFQPRGYSKLVTSVIVRPRVKPS